MPPCLTIKRSLLLGTLIASAALSACATVDAPRACHTGFRPINVAQHDTPAARTVPKSTAQ